MLAIRHGFLVDWICSRRFMDIFLMAHGTDAHLFSISYFFYTLGIILINNNMNLGVPSVPLGKLFDSQQKNWHGSWCAEPCCVCRLPQLLQKNFHVT